MTETPFHKVSFEEIEQYADPHAIKNFILSDNMKMRQGSFFEDPFIVEGVVFGLCINGTSKIKINYKEYEIKADTVLVLLPNQIVKVIEASEDFLIEALFVAFDFIADFPFPKDFEIILHMGEWPCMQVSKDSMQDLLEYHAMIVKQYNQVEQPFRVEIVKGLLYTMLMELIGIYRIKNGPEVKASSWQEELVGRFFKILTTYFRTERSVSFYADKLCLTSKYLSTTVKKVTGQSILSWIHEAILIEARMLLKSTSMTVLQISDDLNFPNPSFFGKFFKEHTGMTPLEYRDK